jgi:RimJ/RimL family protein N-acetyltransferase
MNVDVDCGIARMRSFRVDDAASLARHANNRKIWLNLRDLFPHPYTRANAEQFIAQLRTSYLETTFAIEVDGEAAGAIGLALGKDIEHRSAELGYWLAEPHWGRGITTAVVRAASEHAFANLDLLRVFALPFATNVRSIRVLEKAGFTREGVMRKSAIKDGVVLDQVLFARVAD